MWHDYERLASMTAEGKRLGSGSFSSPRNVIEFMHYICVRHVSISVAIIMNLQSNSVITNFMGPAKFVRYNRGSL